MKRVYFSLKVHKLYSYVEGVRQQALMVSITIFSLKFKPLVSGKNIPGP